MKIPVLKILKLTFQDLWQHKLQWARIMFAPWVMLSLPLLFLVYIEEVYSYFPKDSLMNFLSDILSVLSFFFLLFAICTAPFQAQINSFRFALFGEGGEQWWMLPFNRRLGRMILFFFVYLVIGFIISWGATLCAVLIMIPFVLPFISFDALDSSFQNLGYVGITSLVIGYILGFFGYLIVYFYPLVRLSLYDLFINIDIEEPISESWKLLEKNVWRLFLLRFFFLFVILGIIILCVVFGVSLRTSSSLLGTGFATFVCILLSSFALIFTCAVLSKVESLVYQVLKQKKVKR